MTELEKFEQDAIAEITAETNQQLQEEINRVTQNYQLKLNERLDSVLVLLRKKYSLSKNFILTNDGKGLEDKTLKEGAK